MTQFPSFRRLYVEYRLFKLQIFLKNIGLDGTDLAKFQLFWRRGTHIGASDGDGRRC